MRRTIGDIVADKKTIIFTVEICTRSLTALVKHIKKYKRKSVVVVSSKGGDANAAQAMYAIIKSMDLTTIAIAEAHSAALTIFLAGKRRWATNNSTFMAHNAKSSNTIFNIFYIGSLKIFNEWGKKILKKRNINLGPYIFQRELYFDTSTAREKGVCTRILKSE